MTYSDERALTIDEAAAAVDRPPSTIRRWISEGRLRPVARMGHRKLYLESHVLAVDAATARPLTHLTHRALSP